MADVNAIQISLFKKINKEKQAIDRIKTYAPIALELTGKPFYVAYSGGKDSDAIRILCDLSGIKSDLVHNHTTADTPETVRYIRTIPNIIIDYPNISMWSLIEQKGFPPLRTKRYCCSELKERGGAGRFVMTGVRWSESVQRSTRGSLERRGSSKKSGLVLNADNDEDRRQFENCIKKSKSILNPIIDWTDDEVWTLLTYYGCESNPLYKCGYRRVGCVGCPMAGRNRWQEFDDYPKYKNNYIKAFDRMLKTHAEINYTWQSGEEVFDWWMQERKIPKEIEGQINLWSLAGALPS